MNKYRAFVFCLVLVLFLVLLVGGCAKGPTPEKPVVMRCAAEFAPAEPISVILKELETTIAQRTGGRVKFEYYPAAQLYTFADAVPALQAGDLEMCINGMPASFFVPEWDVICGLPFLIEDGAHLLRLQDTDAYKDFCARTEAKGMKPLTRVYAMDDQPLFNSKRPIAKLEDFKGLKLSVGPSPTFIEATGILSGSKPINVPVAEVPSAVETGLMEGSPFPWPVMTFMDLPRLMPYVTLVPYGVAFPVGLMVSAEWWDTLPSDLQNTLRSIFEDAMAKYGEAVVKVGDEQQRIFTETPGTTVTELTPAERERWLAALKPLYDRMKEDPSLRAIIEAAEATR